jgi:hypothetical protein
MTRHETLILGGGFGGAYVARMLGKRGATIVSPDSAMLYTPVLPEVAAGALEPRHAVVPLRAMCPHAEIVRGRAVALDEQAHRVTVDTELGPHELHVFGLKVRGLLGSAIIRAYHIHQVPLLSRRLRVLADGTIAMLFRRDITELGLSKRPAWAAQTQDA